MSTLTKIFLGLGGGFLVYEVFRFLAVKQMTYSLASVDAIQQGITTKVSLGVKIENPTQWSNTLDGLQGDIYANGKYLGSASVVGPVIIPPYGSEVVPLGLSLSDLALAAVILSIVAGSISQAMVQFVGKIHADGIPIGIPINLGYQVL